HRAATAGPGRRDAWTTAGRGPAGTRRRPGDPRVPPRRRAARGLSGTAWTSATRYLCRRRHGRLHRRPPHRRRPATAVTMTLATALAGRRPADADTHADVSAPPSASNQPAYTSLPTEPSVTEPRPGPGSRHRGDPLPSHRPHA